MNNFRQFRTVAIDSELFTFRLPALHTRFCRLNVNRFQIASHEVQKLNLTGYSRKNHCPGLITVGTLRDTRKLIKTFGARINVGCHAKV